MKEYISVVGKTGLALHMMTVLKELLPGVKGVLNKRIVPNASSIDPITDFPNWNAISEGKAANLPNFIPKNEDERFTRANFNEAIKALYGRG